MSKATPKTIQSVGDVKGSNETPKVENVKSSIQAPSVKYKWIPLEYDEEKPDSDFLAIPMNNHPLFVEEITPIVEKKEEPKENFLDPLRKKEENKQSGMKYTQQVNTSMAQKFDSTILNWQHHKHKILNEHRTDKALPIYSSILFGQVDEENLTFENKIKQRLSMLSSDVNKKTITQKKYIKFLEDLNSDLKKSWNIDNDRVNSLKIVIKCTKMLSKTLVPEFYPSMFVIVVEVMDTFGRLVFERIKNKGTIKDRYTKKIVFKLPMEFTSKQVPARAKEICKNWFFKISSIRELIARIYVEMMIVQSRKFLLTTYEDGMNYEMMRLATSLRGIGDPLVSNYGRFYLAKKSIELLGTSGTFTQNIFGRPNNINGVSGQEKKEFLKVLYVDFLVSLGSKGQLDSKYFSVYLEKVRMTKNDYCKLFIPCGEWITEALGYGGSENLFHEMISLYIQHAPKFTFVLNSIIRSFSAEIVSKNAYKLLELILTYSVSSNNNEENSDEILFRTYHLFQSLGRKFATVSPKEKSKLDLLNRIWKIVTKMSDIHEYLKVGCVFVEYICKSYSLREVNILLKDIYKHIQKSYVHINVTDMKIIENLIQEILIAILQNSNDIIEIFNMKYFLPLFDMLKSTIRIEVSRGILNVLRRGLHEGKAKRIPFDPVIVNSLFDLSKIVHDSINYLTDKSIWNDTEDLVYSFVKSIKFIRREKENIELMYERALDYYVECRKFFPNFDKVRELIIINGIHMINELCSIIEEDKRNKNFIKTIEAFIHITIPSIRNIFSKLRLYLLCSQVCFMNNLIPQGEDLLKRAIFEIKSIPQFQKDHKNNMIISNENELYKFVSNVCSYLISVPGHPKFGPFFLLKAMLNAIENYSFQPGSIGKILCYIKALKCISSLYNSSIIPYKFNNILIQNEDLFDDNKIKQEASSISQTILNQINKNIKVLLKEKSNDPNVIKRLQYAHVEYLNLLLFTSKLNKELLNLIIDTYRFARSAMEYETKVFLDNTMNSLNKKNKKLFDVIMKNV